MQKHVLQWHITHKCNLRCLHCYQEDYNSDLDLDQIKKIFFDYLDFLKLHNFKGHINVTGGEPFLYHDFFSVIDLFEKHDISFGILTNGTLLNDEITERLSKYKKLAFVQISLDGNKRMHNQIRGIGNFEKSINGIRLLNKHNIKSMVAFTAHKKNIKKLRAVIRVVKKEKVKVFWADRLIPTGSCKDMLNTDELLKFTKIMFKESVKANKEKSCVTEIRCNRALMFFGGSRGIYHCSAGTTLLTVLANGDLLPCRRMPIVLGNTIEKSIEKIYSESEIIKEIIENEIPKECENCYKASKCKGGLKCISYALTGKIGVKDINCPIENGKFEL